MIPIHGLQKVDIATHQRISLLQPRLNDLHCSQVLVRTYNCILMGEQSLYPFFLK